MDAEEATSAASPAEGSPAWRKALRAELLARRMGIPAGERRRLDARIEEALLPLIRDSGAKVAAFYWPIRGEFNPRRLMRRLHEEGMAIALPEVVVRHAPLLFRPWVPGAQMRRDSYGIPVPATEEQVIPDAVAAALVGFDGAGYRLGNGGGYYDRTLAVLGPLALVVGVGYECCRVADIHPAAHDVPMQAIVTEAGVERIDRG